MSAPRRISLVGPMGAGKTTVGRRLAELRHQTFCDSDQEIERRTGVDIAYIFEKEGEAGFRQREKQAIAALLEQPGIVLATGGGAVLDADTRRLMASHSVVIYLHAGVEQQVQRTARAENRPLLQNVDRAQTLARLFEVRDPLYREIADLVVYTDGRHARALVREISDFLHSHEFVA